MLEGMQALPQSSPTSRRWQASTSYWQQRGSDRSMHCWPMPGVGWVRVSWIRTRTKRAVLSTPTSGAIYLIQKSRTEMRDRGHGRILITGSIASFMSGTYQAVYNGSKAFVDSSRCGRREGLGRALPLPA